MNMQNKKLCTLLKMLMLSVGIIVLFNSLDLFSKKGTSQSSEAEYTSIYDFSMGTSISIVVYDESNHRKIAEQISQNIKNLDEKYMSWRNPDSELSSLNNNYISGEKYKVSDTMYDIVSLSLDMCEKSAGALDITLRPILNLWNIEEATEANFSIPSESELLEAKKLTGYENVQTFLEDEEGYITINKDNMSIDFGATGKGYALDLVRKILDENDVDGACISVGGSILVYGSKSDSSEWTVGIRNPKGNIDEMIGYLRFKGDTNMCVSTSGDYEKFIEKDGKRYHHIIDGESGRPADSGLASVTVVCESGICSDGLSTACFVLGYEKSLPVLKMYNAEAVFIDKDNNVVVTEGLNNIFVAE